MSLDTADSDREHDFPPCPICGANAWLTVHSGEVRDGAYGKWRVSEVCRCEGCGVDRLAESACLSANAYETAEYRHHIGQDHDVASYFAAHDELARFTLETVWPTPLRGKVIADVGCGGGGLLDHLSGVARQLLAIEPAVPYSSSLEERGYLWYPDTSEAVASHGGQVDIAFSIQVIEHVEDPRVFLREIRELLAADGLAVVSTPNRHDILMDLLPLDFPKFFYRAQHRWAFDAGSLSRCAEAAGFSVAEVRHVHRYGLGNTFHWLKERRPRGRSAFEPLDGVVDKHWQAWLEANGRTDNLYIVLKKADVMDTELR